MAEVIPIRKSEEIRHQILDGIAEYEDQKQFDANYRAMRLRAIEEWHEDNPKAKKPLIDKLFPWLVIAGILALIALGNLGADWVVTIGK